MGDGYYVKDVVWLMGMIIIKIMGVNFNSGGVLVDQIVVLYFVLYIFFFLLEFGIELVCFGVDGVVGYMCVYGVYIVWRVLI